MKRNKVIIAIYLILFLISCGKEEEISLVNKKNSGFKGYDNTIKNKNYSNKNNLILTEEIIFLNDKTKSGKEKIDFIKKKLDSDKESFNNKKNLKVSIVTSLRYLDEKNKEEKKINYDKKGVVDDKIEKKVEELKVEQVEIKEIIEKLIEEEENIAEKLIYEGEVEIVEENFDAALEKFEQAFKEADTNEEKAEALAGQGDVLQEMGNDEEAENAYEEALTYDDENVSANLGDAQYDIDQDLLDEAEENLQNIIDENLLREESIELGMLKTLILSLKGKYNESDKILLGLIDDYGDDIEIYMLLIENNYFSSMLFNLNSLGLPLEQTTSVLNLYKTKGLDYYNKALALDSNRAYAYFYHGIGEYLLGDKSSGMAIVRNGLGLMDSDITLNTQEKKDTFANYVDVIEKINTYNTTFDYTPSEFDSIVQEKIGIFEKFYPIIDRDRLEELTVTFGD